MLYKALIILILLLPTYTYCNNDTGGFGKNENFSGGNETGNFGTLAPPWGDPGPPPDDWIPPGQREPNSIPIDDYTPLLLVVCIGVGVYTLNRDKK